MVKVMWFFVRFCLHDTRGQYLALSEGFTCCCCCCSFSCRFCYWL